MPIACGLSILAEAPASAVEESSSELPEFHNYELNFDQFTKEVLHDSLSDSIRTNESDESAIDSIAQTNLDNSNTTNLETEAFISPPLSVAELSTPDTPADVPLSEDSVTAQQTDEFLQPLEENQSVGDRPDLNLYTQEIGAELDALGQVTSVSQLSDVQPTDWAYQALQGLVERYGCIAGYPDGTYRGQSAMTRYEFAAGLNACLDRISELIAASTADLATQEDLATLQRLQEEFAAELTTLRGRVDGLESRVAELEENQFSTTTRLTGTAIFAVADVFGESGDENQTVGQYRANLDFLTSFTGRDLLVTSIWAGNVPTLGVGFDLPGTRAGGIEIPSAEGTLSSQFGANTNNDILLLTLAYTFPVGEQLLVTVAPGGFLPLYAIAPTLNPYMDDSDGGTGAVSVFGERNAIYSLGSGGGLGLNYFLGEQLRLSAGYLADGLTLSDPRDGRGLFNGGYSAIGQITWTPVQEFSIAATYINAYFPGGRYGFNYNSFAVTGTAVANTLSGQTRLSAQRLFDVDPVITNSYGVQATFQPSLGFAISGWFGATYARLIEQGDGQILNYALTFAFPDLGQEGNLLGLVVGAEPYLTRFEGGDPDDFETDIPFHIEAFYRHQINDNISITPGVIWLTAPNQDNANGNDFIATLRTTFKF
ncbi:MAG: iron uptake porin [Elainellaceae cyanobacterium]